MATTSSQSSAIGSSTLQFQKAGDTEEKEELDKARKNQASWMIGAAVLRLTKLCAPKCLDYERVQISKEETACLDNCVKGMHNVNEATITFFKDFESELKVKQKGLIKELAEEQAAEKATAKQTQKEQRKREAGYVRM